MAALGLLRHTTRSQKKSSSCRASWELYVQRKAILIFIGIINTTARLTIPHSSTLHKDGDISVTAHTLRKHFMFTSQQ